MPGLRFYGRKWQFGADDLTIPTCMCSLSRATWVVLLTMFYIAMSQSGFDCSDDVRWYNSFAIGLYCFSFIIYLTMVIVSCRGTVLEVEKRWCMPSLVKTTIFCIIAEAAVASYGSYLATDHTDPCQEKSSIPYTAMRVVVVGSWIDIFFASCCGCFALSLSTADENCSKFSKPASSSTDKSSSLRCCYAWGNATVEDVPIRKPLLTRISQTSERTGSSGQATNVDEEEDTYDFNSDEERESDSRFGSTVIGNTSLPVESNNDDEYNDYEQGLNRTTKTWSTRLRRLCGCFQCLTCGTLGGINGTGGPEAFQQVSIVLAGWFKNLDLVPSDIVAALFLMKAEQRQMEQNAVEQLLRERQSHGLDRPRRRPFTHVGRWMWSSHGPNERANLRLHCQQIRESRDARRLRASSVASEDTGTPNDVFDVDPEARELLMFASDMAPFMLGMYGWLLYSYMHGIRGWITIFLTAVRRRCCCRRSKVDERQAEEDPERYVQSMTSQFLSPSSEESRGGGARHLFVLDDGCCEFNTTALVQRVGRRSAARADVVYASFASFEGQALPYSVCVDHAKRRVVVAVRGIFTVADALAHVQMVPAPLAPYAAKWGFEDDVGPDSHCHAGILRIAAFIRSDLQRQDILHRLFGISVRQSSADENDVEGRQRAFSVSERELPDCRGYELDITGHSLGAGVAVVLSLFLRPVFPNVRCMAFSPPGCVFDWKLANHCSSWVSCIFVGKDFGPRLSWHSLFKLRAQVLDTLRRDKATKFGAIVSSIAGRPVDQLLYKPDEVPDSKYAREMERKIDELANRRPSALDSIRLYAPGKLLHLMKDESHRRNCCKIEQHYVPMWIDDRSTLDEILLSTRLAFDHFPDVVDSVLQGIVQEYCI